MDRLNLMRMQDAGLTALNDFLNRLWDYLSNAHTLLTDTQEEHKQLQARAYLLKQFQERLDPFKPNTSISASWNF